MIAYLAKLWPFAREPNPYDEYWDLVEGSKVKRQAPLGKDELKKRFGLLQAALADLDFLDRGDPARPEVQVTRLLQPLEIRMEPDENHRRPHVHISHGRHTHAASYAIDNGDCLAGEMRRKHEKMVQSFISRHKPDLLLAWTEMKAGRNAEMILARLRGSS